MKKMRIEAFEGGKGFSFWTFPDPETAFCFVDGGSNTYLPLMSRYRLHPGRFIEVELCGYEVGMLENGQDHMFLNVRIIEPIDGTVKFNGMHMLDEELVTWVSGDELVFTNEINLSYVSNLISDHESRIEVDTWKPNEIEILNLGSITYTA